jgi:hypothetical protein
LFKKGIANRSLAVILPALGVCIPVGMMLAYNMAVFGTPLSIGYNHMELPVFQQGHSQGLLGVGWPNPKISFYLTMHPAMGLFWQSPVLILAMIGIWFMLRVPNSRIESLIALTAFFSLLLINSGYYMWWGGFTFGPRHLIPMLTFLCLPLVFIPKRWFSSLVILSLVSIMQMFIVVSSQIRIPDNFYRQIDKISYFAYSSIYSYCLRRLLRGEFSSNIVNEFLGVNTWLSLVPLLLVIFIITLVFFVKQDFLKSSLSMGN